MASITKKFTTNIPGKYFVDAQCIDCDMCRQIAPSVFKRNFVGNTGHSYVWQQPRSVRDINLCAQAMDACPVNAIGAVKEFKTVSEPFKPVAELASELN